MFPSKLAGFVHCPNDLIQTLLYHSLSYLCMTLSSLNSALCFTQEKRIELEEDKKKFEKERKTKKQDFYERLSRSAAYTACVFLSV